MKNINGSGKKIWVIKTRITYFLVLKFKTVSKSFESAFKTVQEFRLLKQMRLKMLMKKKIIKYSCYLLPLSSFQSLSSHYYLFIAFSLTFFFFGLHLLVSLFCLFILLFFCLYLSLSHFVFLSRVFPYFHLIHLNLCFPYSHFSLTIHFSVSHTHFFFHFLHHNYYLSFNILNLFIGF